MGRRKATPENTLAREFHAYICSNDSARERAYDREGAHLVFTSFYEQRENNKPTKHLECIVMTRLRQFKLLKSKRLGDNVVMTFADANGTLPSIEERITIRDRVLQQRKEAEKDKFGVTVLFRHEESVQTIELGSTASFHFFVQWSVASEGQEKYDGSQIRLESVTLDGPHRRMYKIEIPFALPWPIHEDRATRVVSATVIPQNIGIIRCNVHFNFTQQKRDSNDRVSFSIARYVTTKGTLNPAMEEALNPISEYQKRVIKDRRKVDGVLFPDDDEAQNRDASFNPFKNLPSCKIPNDILGMLQAGEFERLLKLPEISPSSGEIEGYGVFWKHLLWASEFQTSKDIQLFDMEQQELQRDGKYFLLTVPGLAESRPSVLMGDSVKIYWKKHMYLGRVNQVKLLEVRLLLNSKFNEEFSPSLDRVDVRFCLSRTAFRTSHHGCVMAEKSMKGLMLIPDREMVMKAKKDTPRKLPKSGQLKWASRELNHEQQAAVLNVIQGKSRPLPYCIFGPPGTGKTTTLVEIVYHLVKTCNTKVLLVAPSNDAADILLERLSRFFPPSELKRILAYSRSADTVSAELRKYVVQSTAEEIAAGQNKNEHAQCRDILKARIVVATINLAARFGWMGVPNGHFDVLCVDEAGHATEPEVISVASTLIDFYKGDNVGTGQLVLAGDPKQLGPVVTSEVCRRFGLEVSYMERLMSTDAYSRQSDGAFPKDLVTKLVRNYRSHPAIIKLPNEKFYDGELVSSADQMVSHNLAKWTHLPTQGFPILFHGTNGENKREGNSPSWFNPQEAMEVVRYVKLLVNDTKPALKADDIGIITPYHRQAQKIRIALEFEGLFNIKVGSVETFQGQERRCIILSTVRADVEHVESDLRFNLGFVANEKRFNVAITRAKALLIVVGCPSVLQLDKDNWLPFLEYCYQNKSMLGDEWDPSKLDDSDVADVVRKENDKKHDKERDESQAMAEAELAFINREE